MIRKGQLIILINLLLIFCVIPTSDAAYFVFNKKGNIRSGPGNKYRIIGQLAKETIAEIPHSFIDFDAKWIPIDTKTKYDSKTKSEKVVYTKWVHRSIGVIVKGEIEDVEKYLAIRESGWPREMQDLILEGKVQKGMTTHMVFYSWGRPYAVNESPTSDGVKEEWIYKRPGEKTRHLYFEDGVLKAIQK